MTHSEAGSAVGQACRAALTVTVVATALALLAPATVQAQWPSDDAEPAEFAMAMNAKILCSGIWVQGRDPKCTRPRI